MEHFQDWDHAFLEDDEGGVAVGVVQSAGEGGGGTAHGESILSHWLAMPAQLSTHC